MKKFINNINTNTNDESISVEEGRKIVLAMNQVIEKNLNTRKEK